MYRLLHSWRIVKAMLWHPTMPRRFSPRGFFIWASSLRVDLRGGQSQIAVGGKESFTPREIEVMREALSQWADEYATTEEAMVCGQILRKLANKSEERDG
jgi:hypothetical protein